MSKAARAIIIQDDSILVMRRNKQASDYYTLVGGRIQASETNEAGLVREVKEETGLEVTAAQLVFIEKHPAPYNEQYIYICDIVPNKAVALQELSEEALLNKLDFNIHEPMWVPIRLFSQLPFYTSQLQAAISNAISKGFPAAPVEL